MKPETRLQIDLVSWMRQTYPNILFTSTQAGDRRSVLGSIIMKRMGYRNGTPDLIVFAARKGWHGLLVELKTADGALSKAQEEFCEKAGRELYWYVVAYGIDQAKDAISNYFSDADLLARRKV